MPSDFVHKNGHLLSCGSFITSKMGFHFIEYLIQDEKCIFMNLQINRIFFIHIVSSERNVYKVENYFSYSSIL